ncbi:leucine-rich repeat extensin-like protein 6 [Dorcoceras hygrometricum]|uniref:Leucine-rich repeat extensin-like protein 6 n=1 Tax=Dorcoceras hygrometricum TaxID=472368 RepID=A0A2Z7D0D9_9LAMI|nr:leucine-rich repeat extensin-like protein 6 [Dorcoceras hygrometricum]
MTSSLISNTNQVYFASVLGMDNEGMVAMFEALISSGLNGQAKGYAVQICTLLKNVPNLKLGDYKEFPPLKILTDKTVSRYIAINNNIAVEDVDDEPRVKKTPVKKAVSKKRSAATADKPTVKRKRTLVGKVAVVAKGSALVTVAQEAVPLQIVAPIFDMPHAPTRKARKRKLRLKPGSDDESVEKEQVVGTVAEKERETSVDDVDSIIVQVLADTTLLETDMEEPGVIVVEEPVGSKADDITVGDTERIWIYYPDPSERLIATEGEQFQGIEIEVVATTDEESMYIEENLAQIPDNMFLPSIKAADITQIRYGQGIEIREVDFYKASIPQIDDSDKGKESLVEDSIQGHPAREICSLICADIDFLVQLREQVIEDVVQFFNYFSFRESLVEDSIQGHPAREICSLICADIDFLVQLREQVIEDVVQFFNYFSFQTDSVLIAIQRRVLIIAKYRELLLRKFLEARWHNFVSGTPTTAIDLKVLELFTVDNHFALKVLLRQVQEHKLEWTRPSNSLLFEGDNIVRGYFIPRNHRTIFSRSVHDRWAEVCVGVVQFSLIGSLRSAHTINRCRDIVVPLVDIEEIPTEDDSSSSDVSIVYRSPYLHAEPSVQTSPVVAIILVPTDSVRLSPHNSDISLPSPHQSSSSASSMHFIDDILQGADTPVNQISLPPAPIADAAESFTALRASISRIFINHEKSSRRMGKWVCLVTLAMSLFDLQDVCIVIGSLATLDLPMVVDLIGIYVLKGPYCTLTMTNLFLQELSVIPRGSWDDFARRFTMIRWARFFCLNRDR